MNIAIYMRLSKEDEFSHEESNSITMQRLLLRDYVREHFPQAKVLEFADDGYSGTNFDRPGVQALLDGVKNAEINCIIVKDFSRFARDYIELGSYLEQIFPFMGVRFISINDKYDRGSFSGCHPVYGYDVVKEGNRRVLVINEEAAVVVRELFDVMQAYFVASACPPLNDKTSPTSSAGFPMVSESNGT